MTIKHKIVDVIRNLFIDRKRVALHLKEAALHEEQGEFEEACYAYALAIDAGERSVDCKERIQHYFETYGPFTFQTQLKRMKKEFCSCCDSCGEGYHVGITDIIEKIVEKKP